MSYKTNLNDDDIDLPELVAALWSQKLIIICFIILSIFLAILYFINTPKTYTAKAVFQIEQNQANGLNLSGELGALASFAGLGQSMNSGKGLLLERIKSREFIIQASQNLSLSEDPFYNNFDPNGSDPYWKATIKKLIGWRSSELEEEILVQESIIKNYLKFVDASSTSAGAVEIAVIHKNPHSASNYANKIMENIRELIESEENDTKAFRLSYLAETLADSLQEMEAAQNKLKEYALQNSTAARENFITGSVRLDTLRLEKREAEEFMAVLQRLEELVKVGNSDRKAYEA